MGDRLRRAGARRPLGPYAVAAAALGLLPGLAAPADAVQGEPQRLMYVHVPAAWTAYAALTVVMVAGVVHLVRPRPVWDRVGQAAAELGAAMTALAVALGMLWGRPVWGVWWTWDPRLVATLAMLLVALTCLSVRSWWEDPARGGRWAAVAGVAGFAVVPVTHFSVLWWRTLHQPPSILRPPAHVPVDPPMLAALAAGVAAFALLSAWAVVLRVHALTARAEPRDVPPASTPACEPVLETVG
ncbi:cytochrome c biogenesis protein CcsA [Sphaerisporangium fuscum]|uniref:cytochrome c biogenesis protein CcsA n=1 Tax=Sphaerisporangium fuscum TaxID=2835868 RepID=UPI001BDD2382|nr:cytochrome c biogenesis protein CcsA [Sphaerisporangium fuscum]